MLKYVAGALRSQLKDKAGEEGNGTSGTSEVRTGRQGTDGRSATRTGEAGMERQCVEWRGMGWRGTAGEDRPGTARCGSERCGLARQARHGE